VRLLSRPNPSDQPRRNLNHVRVHFPLPSVVERLLAARGTPELEQTWSDFVEEYSRLILHVARAQGGSYDEVMDRYVYVLDQLGRDRCRRLRGYAADGRGKFTTWLVVVVRRLCLDQLRSRYGRHGRAAEDLQRQRRQLADLVSADVELDLLPVAHGPLPDEAVRSMELRDELNAAIANLDPADRLLLRLRFQDEVPVAEIARMLGLPTVFHVYRQVNRACDQLRTALRSAGVEDAAP
jgi:RNA polymerase sigma factor (sigma-70 family)